ncbi:MULTISPECIES: hypothetical protein [Streptomyces]|uniref:Helicase n=1 Tax=Streptomyces virginiae TaxID=1961 RepID=A0ABZ1T349_STRVG|nr:hypothetical protein [Streptomyces virginiae]
MIAPQDLCQNLTLSDKARLSNTRSRRDELDQAQRAGLAELGVEWAQ